MKTWREIITDAQTYLGISGVTAPANSPDTEKMLVLLKSIILSLEAKEIYLGANLSDGLLEIDEQSNIPEQQELAIITRLAVFSAPIFQITVTIDLRRLAKETYLNLFSVIPPLKQQNPFQPTGQGDRYYDDRPKFMINGYYGYENRTRSRRR